MKPEHQASVELRSLAATLRTSGSRPNARPGRRPPPAEYRRAAINNLELATDPALAVTETCRRRLVEMAARDALLSVGIEPDGEPEA